MKLLYKITLLFLGMFLSTAFGWLALLSIVSLATYYMLGGR